jgi:radical SAM protein with 4Fe4S-binding SPASM domain
MMSPVDYANEKLAVQFASSNKLALFARGCRKLTHPERNSIRAEYPPLPTHIQVEITTTCNFNCVTCSRKLFPKERLNKNMTCEQLAIIAEQIPTLEWIHLQGEGEPFMNPHLMEMLQYCDRKNYRATTVTNATMLDKHMDMLKYIYRMVISIDSPNKKSYESIRVGGNFEKTMNNIRQVMKAKKEKGYVTEIATNMVVCRENYLEIPEMVELGSSLGIPEVSFVEVQNWQTEGEKGYDDEKKFIQQEREISPLVHKMINEQQEKHPEVEILYTPETKQKSFCDRPFCWPYITVEGYLTPCCRRVNPNAINFGNVFEKPFTDLWYSKKIRDFRKSMINNTLNKICDECPG